MAGICPSYMPVATQGQVALRPRHPVPCEKIPTEGSKEIKMQLTFTAARDLRKAIFELIPNEMVAAEIYDDIQSKVRHIDNPSDKNIIRVAICMPISGAFINVPDDKVTFATPIAVFYRHPHYTTAFTFEGIRR